MAFSPVGGLGFWLRTLFAATGWQRTVAGKHYRAQDADDCLYRLRLRLASA
jgi:hypothetical protein